MGIKLLFKRLFGGYNNRRGEKVANKFLDIRVRNPFDPSVTCTLGDLCIMGYITEADILNIARENGIEFPTEAADFSGNNVLQYLLYHGKPYNFTFYNDAGEKVTAGIMHTDSIDLIQSAAPPVTRDHLEHMISMFQGNGESWNSVYGQAAEFHVRHQLEKAGYEVLMPADRNYEATDLIVEKRFFNDMGTQYTESPDFPGHGLLQVKTSSGIFPTNDYTSNTLHHLQTNPDIPVICSSKIAASLGNSYPSHILSFSDIGLNDAHMESMLCHQFEQLKYLNPHALECLNGVAFGLDASVFHDTMDSARTSVFSHVMGDSGVMESSLNIGFHNIPVIGMALRGSLALANNVEKARRGEISYKDAYANTARVVAKTAVVGTATSIGTGLVLGALGTSVGAQVNGLAQSIFSGDNAGNIASSAFQVAGVLALAGIIGGIATSIYDKFFDPKKKYNEKVYAMNMAAANIAIFLTRKLNSNEFLGQFEHPSMRKLQSEIQETMQKRDKIKRENSIYPFSYYVAKRKINFLTPIYNQLYDEYNKIVRLWNYLAKSSSFLVLSFEDKKNKTRSREEAKSAYLDYNYDSSIKKLFRENGNSNEDFLQIIIVLIKNDIVRLMPYIKNINNDALHDLIYAFEQSTLDAYQEYEKLVQKGIITVASAHA